jgi:hypothetical protein
VNVNTKKLLAAVEKVIRDTEQRAEGDYLYEVAEHNRLVQQWWETKAKRLDKVLIGLAAKLDNHEVVTTEDLRGLYDGGLGFYHHNFVSGEPKRSAQPVDPEVLALRDFLKSVDDETVNTTTLNKLGFTNIQKLLRTAV